jgi:uncharacterized protein
VLPNSGSQPGDPSHAEHTADEKTWAALAHASAFLNFAGGVGGFIAALIIWLTQKEKSRWVDFHALQSVLFQGGQIAVVIVVVGGVWAIGFFVSFITVGIGTLIAVPVMILVFFLGFVVLGGGMAYSLYGAYQIYQGKEFRYRWLGDWICRRFFDNHI